MRPTPDLASIKQPNIVVLVNLFKNESGFVASFATRNFYLSKKSLELAFSGTVSIPPLPLRPDPPISLRYFL